jgi:hypothetical protein
MKHYIGQRYTFLFSNSIYHKKKRQNGIYFNLHFSLQLCVDFMSLLNSYDKHIDTK